MNTPLTLLKTTNGRKFLAQLCCGVALLGFAYGASGALIAYEGFDYTVGSMSIGRSGIVTDWNGGIGWADAWEDIPPDGGNPFINPASSTLDSASDIMAGSLGYTDIYGHTLVTSGHKLHNSGVVNNATSRPARNLATMIITNGTTTWLSFLGQRTGQSNETTFVYDRGANLTLFNTNVWGLTGNNAGRFAVGESSGTAVGQPNDTWGLMPLGQGTARRQSNVAFTNLALIVVRVDHHDDNDPLTVSNAIDFDDLYLWINPTNLAVEPPIASAFTNYLTTDPSVFGGLDFAFNRVVMFAGNLSGANPAAEWLVDEIRIGTTYADVVPYTGPVLPRWTSIVPSGGGISLTLTGAPNATFNVQLTTDLGTPSWSTIGNVNLNGGGVGNFLDTGTVATNQQRYYRASP